MTIQQPEALDLADWLEAVGGGPSAKRCAALLREQHARIAELESELEAIGAGGVSGPLIGRAALSANAGEQDDHQILAITTAYEQGVGKGHQAYNSGKEIANPYSPAYRCDLAWQYGYKEGKEQAQREAKAAPQQEAQEPSKAYAWVYVNKYGVESIPASKDWCTAMVSGHGGSMFPLYTAPLPAPATQQAPQQEAQEPAAWQSRTRPTWGGNTRPWSPWEPCTKGQAEDCWKTPLLHDWAYEARALFTAPQPAPATQKAHQQEAQEPAAVVVPCHTPSGKRVALYSAKQDLPIGTQLYTAPQPSPITKPAPQPAPAPLSDDTKRLDWLDRNIFSREMSEWDAKYGHGPDYNMWVVFSPKGVQGSARNIIDAALAAQGGKDA